MTQYTIVMLYHAIYCCSKTAQLSNTMKCTSSNFTACFVCCHQPDKQIKMDSVPANAVIVNVCSCSRGKAGLITIEALFKLNLPCRVLIPNLTSLVLMHIAQRSAVQHMHMRRTCMVCGDQALAGCGSGVHDTCQTFFGMTPG